MNHCCRIGLACLMLITLVVCSSLTCWSLYFQLLLSPCVLTLLQTLLNSTAFAVALQNEGLKPSEGRDSCGLVVFLTGQCVLLLMSYLRPFAW